MRKRFALLLAAVVAVGLAFGAGLASCQSGTNGASQTAARTPDGAQANGIQSAGQGPITKDGAAATQGGNSRTSRMVNGSVTAVDGNTVTVSTQQGDTKVKLDGAKIQKTVDGSIEDLKPGQRVMVTGQSGPDGSFSATTVQVVPPGETGGRGGPGAMPAATPTAPTAGR